jgi:hypothetical protein
VRAVEEDWVEQNRNRHVSFASEAFRVNPFGLLTVALFITT